MTLTTAGDGTWTETRWRNDGPDRTLVDALCRAEPRTAFRQYRIYRAADHALLANGGWDRARTREIRIWPEDAAVPSGAELLVRAVAWWPTAVTLWVTLTWQP